MHRSRYRNKTVPNLSKFQLLCRGNIIQRPRPISLLHHGPLPFQKARSRLLHQYSHNPRSHKTVPSLFPPFLFYQSDPRWRTLKQSLRPIRNRSSSSPLHHSEHHTPTTNARTGTIGTSPDARLHEKNAG